MIRVIKTMLLVSGLMFASTTLAHPNHDDVVQLNQATAVEKASAKLIELVDEGSLPSSWAQKPASGAQLARIDGRQNWIVSYLDEPARERLELVFSLTGEYVSMDRTPISDTAAR